jgi:hypothetical protein
MLARFLRAGVVNLSCGERSAVCDEGRFSKLLNGGGISSHVWLGPPLFQTA